MKRTAAAREKPDMPAGRLLEAAVSLFAQHGFEPARWPAAMREVVFG